VDQWGILSSPSLSFYINISRETMKFRIKITTKNSGEITYTPQVKKSFFARWKGLNKGAFSIYISKYCWEVFSSEVDAILFTHMYKKQELNNKKTVTYKRIK
jgi:hypothetical protein